MNNEQQFEQIEAFIKGNLSPQEEQAMKEAIANDPELAELVNQHRIEHRSIELLLEDDLRGKLTAWKDEPEGNSTSGNYRILFILAGLITILLLLIVFLLPQQADNGRLPSEEDATIEQTDKGASQNGDDQTPEAREKQNTEQQETSEPANKSSKPLPQANNDTKQPETTNYIALVESAALSPSWAFEDQDLRGDTETTAMEEIKTLIEENKQQEAITALKNITPEDELYWDAQNNLGYIYFQMENYEEAAKVFEKLVTEQSYYLFRENAEWHLLLAYLETDQKQKAKELLDILLEDKGHYYHEEVVKLAPKLDL